MGRAGFAASFDETLAGFDVRRIPGLLELVKEQRGKWAGVRWVRLTNERMAGHIVTLVVGTGVAKPKFRWVDA
jgi:hypothetical protein